jgi:subtilisin family serine protease
MKQWSTWKMKNVILLAFIIFSSFSFLNASEKISPVLGQKISQATPGQILQVWVFFKDKGENLSTRLQAAEQSLLPKARERRLRHFGPESELVDFYDIPVNSVYIANLQNFDLKIRHKSRWLNAVSIDVSPEVFAQIKNLDFIMRLDLVFTKDEPIEIIESLSKPQTSGTPGLENFNYGSSYTQNNQINVISLHNLGYDGSGVTVAMLDAGFNNLQHEALLHLNIIKTWDFVNGDSIVWDEPGQMGSGNHGTLTLSALAGFKEGALIGPAFGADFLLAKTENTDYERHIEEDHWVAGAEWADSLGADIISSSLGYRDGFTAPDTDYTWQDMDGNTTIVTIGADIAASRGILVVNSAGNEGPASGNINTIIAPSDGDSVLAVGAVNSTGTRSSFSSMGPTADGRIKPDVMAMGSSTVCASTSSTTTYRTASGTSLSCPLVAGAAALVLQANPQSTNMEIIQALKNTASQSIAPDNAYGWGIINAFQAANSITQITEGDNNIIGEIKLYANYPNPFNPITTISYDIPRAQNITLSVFNILGEKITTLFDGWVEPGRYEKYWNATQMSSGMYYFILEGANDRQIQKAVLLK